MVGWQTQAINVEAPWFEILPPRLASSAANKARRSLSSGNFSVESFLNFFASGSYSFKEGHAKFAGRQQRG
jgi:hypothetical protein